MSKKIILPSAIAILLCTSGCYVNYTVLNPFSAAPKDQGSTWTPTCHAKKSIKKVKLPILPAVPSQDLPLSLAEMLNIGLNNNANTQNTWAEARQAAASYAQSQSSDLPNYSGSYSVERDRSPSFSTGQINVGKVMPVYLTYWGPQSVFTYTLLDFGQGRATAEAARQALYFADWTHNREIQTVIQMIATDYYNYIYQKQLLESYAEDMQDAQVTLDAASVGLDSGVKDISDVLQARSQLLQDQINWINQQQQVVNSFAKLLNDMGVPPNLDFEVQDLPPVDPSKELIQSVDELVALALQDRPDLLAAQAEVRSKEENLFLAKRTFWPTVDYTLDFGRTTFGSGAGNDGYDFSSIFSLSVPVFAGFYDENGIKLAEAELEQAEAQLLQVELGVIKDITTAHYNVKVSFEALEFAKEFYLNAKKQFEVTLRQYKTGTKTILDVVSAQTSLANARAAQVQATQSWFTSLVNLSYATGDLTSQPKEFE